jgi:signal transduction histidine kinase
MFERPADRFAAAIAFAAIVLATLYVAMNIASRQLGFGSTWLLVPLAVAMLLVGSAWLRRQAPQSPFRELALPVATATVIPLFVLATADTFLARALFILGALALFILGARLAEHVPPARRLAVIGASGGLAALGAALALVQVSGSLYGVAVVLLAASTAVPGLAAGASQYLPGAAGSRRSVVDAVELAVIGLTPAIAVITLYGSLSSPGQSSAAAPLPLIAWILFVLAAHYFAVQPLAERATTATTQRDVVVAAMEAERSRIAADIHDDALQELTLLGWRLDAAGDNEGAAAAREVADRLRAICGDLRLPILDDLGAGSALEWLVERVGRLAGGEVRLERGDQIRPPADVELAFFRVAQEALSNAVRHGRPPIVVRYWTTPTAASMAVDDAGDGIDPARLAPSGEGHFGMLNMRQRAEQIGALLEIRRWPAGGTQVTLEWRAG